jgi:hypothetical protein
LCLNLKRLPSTVLAGTLVHRLRLTTTMVYLTQPNKYTVYGTQLCPYPVYNSHNLQYLRRCSKCRVVQARPHQASRLPFTKQANGGFMPSNSSHTLADSRAMADARACHCYHRLNIAVLTLIHPCPYVPLPSCHTGQSKESTGIKLSYQITDLAHWKGQVLSGSQPVFMGDNKISRNTVI